MVLGMRCVNYVFNRNSITDFNSFIRGCSIELVQDRKERGKIRYDYQDTNKSYEDEEAEKVEKYLSGLLDE